jgi:hypothetical protein
VVRLRGTGGTDRVWRRIGAHAGWRTGVPPDRLVCITHDCGASGV